MDPKKTKTSAEPNSTAKTVQMDASERHPLIGQTLGTYRIEDVLGKGGMGVVFRATDTTLDRKVALKVLAPELSGDAQYVQRFLREAKAAAALEHDNIVHVYAAGQQQGSCWIAMQYAKGVTLSSLLRKGRKFTVKESLALVRQVASALGEAHKAGIVHRDIKPSNIMIDEAGKAMVMDFGLSRAIVSEERITRTGTYLGTPEYSSPEQCETNDLDGRSDLYSLGVVLYELLTGRVPHVAETPLALFRKIAEERPTPVTAINKQVPAGVQALLDRLLAKDRERRYRSAEEVVGDIDKLLAGKGVPSPAPAQARGRGLKIAAVALALAAAVGLVVWKWPHKETLPVAGPVQPTEPAPSVTPTPQVDDGTQVVVLDFKDIHSNKDDKWMSVGIPEMLVGKLDALMGGDVVPREMLLETMAEVVGKKVQAGGNDSQITLGDDLNQVLSRLHARTLVTGTYLVNGDQVVITATLYERKAGAFAKLTTAQEGGASQDLFGLIDRLAGKLAGARPKSVADALSAGRGGAMRTGASAPDAEGGEQKDRESAKHEKKAQGEAMLDDKAEAKALKVTSRINRVMDALRARRNELAAQDVVPAESAPAQPGAAGAPAPAAPPARADARQNGAKEVEEMQKGGKNADEAKKWAAKDRDDLSRLRRFFTNLAACEEADLKQQKTMREDEGFLNSLCEDDWDTCLKQKYETLCKENASKEQKETPAK